MNGPDHLLELGFEFLETGFIVLAATGKMRRDVGIRDLVFAAGDYAHPRLPELLDRWKENDIVHANQIGTHFIQQTWQVFLRPDGGINNGVPTVANVILDLIVRRLVEVRDVTIDKVLPILR